MGRVDVMNAWRRFVAPLSKRVRLMVSRGVVLLVNDALKCQGLQVELLQDEVLDNVEHFQEYGFTSVPASGAEVLFLSVGGNRGAGIVACVTDRRYRPTNLNEGDVCLFTISGERVYLDKANDIVNLGAKSAADFVALADLVKDELDQIKTDFDAHTHSATGIFDSVSGACTGATAAPSAMTTPNSVAATKVKAT